jgi:hypothetical protein
MRMYPEIDKGYVQTINAQPKASRPYHLLQVTQLTE